MLLGALAGVELDRERHQGKDGGQASALDVDAREFNPILGGDYQLTARFESNPEEKLFGMGQYQQPYLNIKGCTLELACHDRSVRRVDPG